MKVVLIGNPNCGKSSLFNNLTGLRQKVGNFPGVTVDKKTGFCKISDGNRIQIIDLPGTYSLYPNSLDEQVVLEILLNNKNSEFPDLAVLVVDSSNLKRNLLLFEQVKDLGIPMVLALNMLDVAHESGVNIDTLKLEKALNVPVVEINAREGIGLEGLKLSIFKGLESNKILENIASETIHNDIIQKVKTQFGLLSDYAAQLYLSQYDKLSYLSENEKKFVKELNKNNNIKISELQSKDVLNRYENINKALDQVQSSSHNKELTLSQKIDSVLIHKVWGYVIFIGILFLIFQSVFTLASYPMDLIDSGIASLNDFLKSILPDSKLTSLLTDGLIAGIGGVIIFIPQIAFLFAFISLLEESGYMARVVVLMDRVIRRFGLTGRSVVPLISSLACAVPAIMSARTIGNWKERLITIFVTPLMSCSARLPIYTVLISLIMPDTLIFGFIGWQGIALMALYLLGFFAALLSGWIMKLLLKTQESNYFVMELPTYKKPRWKFIGIDIIQKVKTFVFEAGKVIVAISIVLWVLASYGPGEAYEHIDYKIKTENTGQSKDIIDAKVAAAKLELSYAGHFGKFIEPALKPLGYDWKIGIALITSFAAREVFVGTVSTIYSIGASDDATNTIKEKLKNEVDPVTGRPVFTVAVAWSLLIFYAFAMMCMSTLAVVYRETKSWTWPVYQLIFMSALAYVAAWVVYNVLK